MFAMGNNMSGSLGACKIMCTYIVTVFLRTDQNLMGFYFSSM